MAPCKKGAEHLVMSPLGQPLGGGKKLRVACSAVLQLCTTVKNLAVFDLLHKDISYGSATSQIDHVLLLDLLTMRKISEGIPLFLFHRQMYPNPLLLSFAVECQAILIPAQELSGTADLSHRQH